MDDEGQAGSFLAQVQAAGATQLNPRAFHGEQGHDASKVDEQMCLTMSSRNNSSACTC